MLTTILHIGVCHDSDFTDKPEMLQASPIGLQLHSNAQPQEHRFRDLLLTENPTDALVTLRKP